MLQALGFLLGLAALTAGAESLVRGASRLAATVGISPLVIGLTVVAFGTSTPELAVSVHAALAGQGDIALGNVVGSNICNVLLILGLAACITPLVVAQRLVRLDVPLMIGVSLLLCLLALDGRIGRLEGGGLFGGIVAYTAFAIFVGRRESATVSNEYAEEFGKPSARDVWSVLRNAGLALVGLALLVVGARWFVDGAVAGARTLGVDELVIGLTVVAVGTSLPEIATSLVASIRGESDIAVGNVVGSNLFNVLAVLGLSGIVAPEGVPVTSSALRFDLPVMVAATIACLPVFFTGHRIARWEGVLFLGYYVAYVVCLVLAQTRNAALVPIGIALVGFALPLTALTLAVSVWRHRRSHAEGRRNA